VDRYVVHHTFLVYDFFCLTPPPHSLSCSFYSCYHYYYFYYYYYYYHYCCFTSIGAHLPSWGIAYNLVRFTTASDPVSSSYIVQNNQMTYLPASSTSIAKWQFTIANSGGRLLTGQSYSVSDGAWTTHYFSLSDT
jgi:hypothetical protein